MNVKAEKFFRQGKLKQAEGVCAQILKSDKSDAKALCLMSRILHDQGNVNGGMEYLKKALAIDPKLSANHVALGVYSLTMGGVEDALQSFVTAYKIDSNNLEALWLLGKVNADKKDWILSSGFLALYIEKSSDNTQVKQFFADTVKNLDDKNLNEMHENAIYECLLADDVNPQNMVKPWAFFVNKKVDFSDAEKAMNDPLLKKGLAKFENIPEGIITSCQMMCDGVLKQYNQTHFDDLDVVPTGFIYAMAMAASRYEVGLSSEIQTRVKKLKNDIEVSVSEIDRLKPQLYLYSCYQSPKTLSNIDWVVKRVSKNKSEKFSNFKKLRLDIKK